MQELGDAIILNADTNTITTEYDDLATLPQDAVSITPMTNNNL